MVHRAHGEPIGRITHVRLRRGVPVPTADSEPWGIAAGPDGYLYFIEYKGGRIARINTDGVITELGTPISTSFPQFIALGPDGAMWFTENGANRLGRIARPTDGSPSSTCRSTIPHPTGIAGRSDGTSLLRAFQPPMVGLRRRSRRPNRRRLRPPRRRSPTRRPRPRRRKGPRHTPPRLFRPRQ